MGVRGVKWQEVRKLYPNQFVKLEVLESRVIGNKEYVDDVVVIKAISDGKEAMREFVNCKPGQFIYSTKNKEIVIQLTKNIGIRRSIV
jgi:hypothetical protein